MIYSPKGYVVSQHIADPARLQDEFMEAYRSASGTMQWNWSSEAFSSPTYLTDDESVVVDTVAVSVDEPPFDDADDQTFPAGSSAVADTWTVPFNSSYLEVGDGDVALEWTSQYPELVLCAFSMQYVRATLDGLKGSTHDEPPMPRLRCQIMLDGSTIAGTGPYAKAEDASTRGSGSQQRTVAATFVGMAMLPAGAHRVTPVACLGPSLYSQKPHDEGDYEFVVDEADDDGMAAIHNRRMTVIRFAKGAWMGA